MVAEFPIVVAEFPIVVAEFPIVVAESHIVVAESPIVVAEFPIVVAEFPIIMVEFLSRYSIIVNSPRPIQKLAFSRGEFPGKIALTCVYLLWISYVR